MKNALKVGVELAKISTAKSEVSKSATVLRVSQVQKSAITLSFFEIISYQISIASDQYFAKVSSDDSNLNL